MHEIAQKLCGKYRNYSNQSGEESDPRNSREAAVLYVV